MEKIFDFIKRKKYIIAIIAVLVVIVTSSIIIVVANSNKEPEKNDESKMADKITTENKEDATTPQVTTEPPTTEQPTTEPPTTEPPTTEPPSTEKVTEKQTQEQIVNNGTPVSKYGKLKVTGAHLTNESGQTVQLKGVSTHGIAWFPQYVTKETFQTFRDEWGVELIRIAMYTAEYNGYCSGGNQQELKELVNKGVQYATELGMYVIIDWHILHDLNPQNNKEAAKAFFDEMSSKYKGHTNVIYEICNEPNGGCSWEGDIKPYAEEVISIIRKNDPDAVVIVGTPTWSQDVDNAAASPLDAKYGNVMYALHYYAATHKEFLQDKMIKAINAGLPIFVSEFSICDASGNGGLDKDSAGKWLSLLNQYDISFVTWSVSNKNESSALISPSCDKVSGWNDNEISESGKWFKYISK